MRRSNWDAVLDAADGPARRWLAGLPDVRVGHAVEPDVVRAAITAELTDAGIAPEVVVDSLASEVGPYLTAFASGRFFGFVIGGLHPAALGAELLVAAWDQNAGLFAPTPGVAIVEEHAARWLVELLGLPDQTATAFVTGAQMANWVCLSAARGHLLRAAGWDVGADGLHGAPPLSIVTKQSTHSTVPRALRYLGLGERTATVVGVDDDDRIDLDELQAVLEATSGPTLVCVEAGSINTGAFDPFDGVADLAQAHRDRGHPTWVHVDGAIGLFAAASSDHAHLTRGLARLDSWSTDGHKLLNVGYDSGIAFTAHPADHRAAMSVRAAYLDQADGGVREPMDWTPEFSRRARGVGVYATLRSLGRDGVRELVLRTARLARRFADGLVASGAAVVLNEVTFNQVAVRWRAPDGVDPDSFNDAVTAATVRDGRTYFTGGTHRGQRIMRVSVSDWATDTDDVDHALEVLLELAAAEAERLGAGARG